MQDQQTAKFGLNDLLPIAIGLVVVAIGCAYGLSVLDDVKEENCGSGLFYDDGNCWGCGSGNFTLHNSTSNLCYNASNSSFTNARFEAGDEAYNGSHSGALGVGKIPAKLPIIATVVIAAIIIGILVRYLYVRFS